MSFGLLRAVGWQALGAGLCAGVSFGLLLLLGRVLGTEAFGVYVLLLNLGTLGLVLIEAGWPTLLYRAGVRGGGAGRELRGLMANALLHVLVVAAGLAVAAFVLGGGRGVALSAALACMGGVAVMNLVSGRMRAAGSFGVEAAWQSAGRLVSAGLIVLVVSGLAWRELGWIFAAWALGLVVVIAQWGRAWLVWPSVAGASVAYRRVWPFLLMGGLAMWLLKGDVVLLGGWRGGLVDAQDLSFYAAGTRLTEACLLLAAPLGNVLLGRFSQLGSMGAMGEGGSMAGRGQLRRLSGWLTAGLFAMGAVVVAITAASGEWLMTRMFGEAFASAGALLPWVLGVLPFALGNVVLVPLLNSLECERGLAVCMAAGGAVLLLAMPWMAMAWGVRGGALGMMLAHAVVFVTGWGLAWEAMAADAGKKA